MIKQSARSRKKHREDKKAQLVYWQEHRNCEVCLAEGRGKGAAIQIHEIKFRSQGGKCVPDNMISTCLADHERMHFRRAKWLYREELYKMKGENDEKKIRDRNKKYDVSLF